MRYAWFMNAATTPDAVKCKAFPIYLEDVALMLFTRLLPWSVSNFTELSERFMNQFRLHAQKSKTIIEVSRSKQAPGEALKSYLDRFNLAVTEVSDPHEPTILMALIEGVDPDTEFRDYLAGKPPPTRELFYEKANIRLRREEAKANRKRKSEGALKEGVQSNIAVQQSGDSSRKVEVNVGN